ncbi:MAG: NADPH-dependent assimilatory sulfite reductase hemoprotein subunit, partial [Chloroflexales bacterium]|nr:NADPH-dependent assimilatory sulfite reductase hemoprotein subunit [Chloroflexales bacterium]
MTTADPTRRVSHVEEIKLANPGFGGVLLDEMRDLSRPSLSDEAEVLLKSHGSYQQDDRDQRPALKRAGQERAWQFMVRTRAPGGRMTAAQYLLADELATSYANGTLRITTRQALQLHGVGKANLKPLIKALNERLVTTYAACGDVARNVVTCPVADLLPGHDFDLQALARRISDRFLPESTAYYELWLDGEKVLADGRKVQVTPSREESFYGPTYMPRKHKMALGLPHDNCVDLFTHDLALEAVTDGPRLRGFNLVAGGGLGSTHGKAETFPRLGDRVGFLPPEQAMTVIEAASAIYRDEGDRANRRHARLKYLLEDRGVDWLRAELARRLGWALGGPAEVGPAAAHDHLGWHAQADGDWLVGVWVASGRVKDEGERRVRSGLRAIVAQTGAEVRLTAQQNIVLARITPADRSRVETLIAEYGLSTAEGEAGLTTLRRHAMACPALPTCGLAVAEAERYLPELLGELEQRGLAGERVTIRLSGCPNSCSRPPSAEIGLIGRSLGLYNVYVGGSPAGTRLARLYQAGVRSADLPAMLGDLLARWRAERADGEAFGDWATRAGLGQGW